MMIIKVFAKGKDGKKSYFRGKGANGTFLIDTIEQLNSLLSALGRQAKKEGKTADWDLIGWEERIPGPGQSAGKA